jgi:type II secretory pathway pseudopilin PulG
MKFERHRLPGFSLVELALALGVASFCLLAIVGLFPTSLSTNQRTIQQTADTTLARAIAADLSATTKTTPPTDQTSPRYGITIPAPAGTASSVSHTIFLREDGTAAGAQDSDADPSQDPKYRATITFVAPPSPQRKATTAKILLTWPALADKSAGTAPTKYAGSYETFTALDRN